jgi:5-hydroxyisourate hydrolase
MKVVMQIQDSNYGKPAVAIAARLARAVENSWLMVADAETNADGRIVNWSDRQLERGLYQIVVDVESYFAGLGLASAYPEITVMFRAGDDLHEFHVQIILAPYSYTAYCGTAGSNS